MTDAPALVCLLETLVSCSTTLRTAANSKETKFLVSQWYYTYLVLIQISLKKNLAALLSAAILKSIKA